MHDINYVIQWRETLHNRWTIKGKSELTGLCISMSTEDMSWKEGVGSARLTGAPDFLETDTVIFCKLY